MTRIRYTQVSENVLKSTTSFLTNSGDSVSVELNTLTKEYFVYNTSSNTIVDHGQRNSLVALKTAARQVLQMLGVVFQTEVRNRTTKDAA